MTTKESNVKTVLLSTLAFWAITLLGPLILVLWNAISLVRYSPGELGYFLFTLSVQSLACIAATWAASKISDDRCPNAVFLNTVIAGGFMAFLTITEIVYSISIERIISYGLATVTLIVCAVFAEKHVRAVKSQKDISE